jgi:hypothetical protein
MAYTFLSWLRSGLAAAIEDQPQAVGAGRRAKLQDGVNVAGTGLPAQTGTTDLDVLGPGDVLSWAKLVRTRSAVEAVEYLTWIWMGGS